MQVLLRFFFMHSLSGTDSKKSVLLFYNCVGCHSFGMILFPDNLITIKVFEKENSNNLKVVIIGTKGQLTRTKRQ